MAFSLERNKQNKNPLPLLKSTNELKPLCGFFVSQRKPLVEGINLKIFLPAAFLMIFLFMFLFSSCETKDPVWAQEIQWDSYSNEQIVSAIWYAEGGNKTNFPYGIRSIDTKGNKEYARKICLNSVRNGRARWIKAGRLNDLITFIGKRFCPPTAHKLNSNWVSNVKFWLAKARAK